MKRHEKGKKTEIKERKGREGKGMEWGIMWSA